MPALPAMTADTGHVAATSSCAFLVDQPSAMMAVFSLTESNRMPSANEILADIANPPVLDRPVLDRPVLDRPVLDRPVLVNPVLTDWAWRLIREVVPNVHRPTSCLYFAAAAAAALGSGWRFQAGGAMLASSGMTGWGLSVSPRDKQYYVTADHAVDSEDGSYCGHCWVQGGNNLFSPVVDIMEGYYGPRQKPDQYIVYHALPSLTRSIKQHYATSFTAVRRRVNRDKDFAHAVRIVAQKARDETWANT